MRSPDSTGRANSARFSISRSTMACWFATGCFFILHFLATVFNGWHGARVATAISAISLGLFLMCGFAGSLAFAVDMIRALAQTRQAKPAPRAQPERQVQASPSAQAALFADLDELYRKHGAVLADQIREVAKPDRYGIRDAEAAAREFNHFHDQLVVPALLTRGHDAEQIRAVFAANRAALLRPVISRL